MKTENLQPKDEPKMITIDCPKCWGGGCPNCNKGIIEIPNEDEYFDEIKADDERDLTNPLNTKDDE